MSETRRFGVLTSDSQQDFENKQKRTAFAAQSTVVLPEGFSFFKYPRDKNFIKVDIIPFVANTENGQVPLARINYHIHRGIGPSNDSYICPQNQKGLPCPICEYMRKLDWNDPQEQHLRKSLRPQVRQLYAVVQVDGPPETKDKVYILDTSEWNFGHILDDKIKNRDMSDPAESNWNKYADLLEGWTLKLNLEEKTYNGSKYVAVSSIDIKPRTTQYDETWYDKVPDLSQCLTILEYDNLKERFHDSMSKPAIPGGPDEAPPFDVTGGFNPMVQSNGTDSKFPEVSQSYPKPDDSQNNMGGVVDMGDDVF